FVASQVAFVDPQLEQAVRDALAIPSDPLTLTHMAALTSLDADWRGITNLAGIESAINLDRLNLGGNPGIADFTPLLALATLNELQLYDCGLTDVVLLASLFSLTS